MLRRFRIHDQWPHNLAAGASLGARHVELLLQQVPLEPFATTTVVIDFDGIEGATGSYLKAFVVHLIRCRQVALDPKEETPPDARSFELFVEHLSEDVATDLRGVLVEAGVACLEALEWDASRVRRARVHGDLDPAVDQALKSLVAARAATAAHLGAAHRKIGVTAWHYRLGVLLKLGLARRVKSERSWVYEPAAMEVSYG